jgi:hypothetical protein
MKIVGMTLLLVGMAGGLLAGTAGNAPEIDPRFAATAFALLSGTLLIVKSRRKK